jgi:hypothetical protein
VDAVVRQTSRRVRALDPNLRLTASLLADASFFADGTGAGGASAALGQPGPGTVSVEVVSKVALAEPARRGIARLVEPVSPATASALLSYAHVPGLF